MNTKLPPVLPALALLALLALLACGRGGEGPALSVENAWARAMKVEVGEEGPLPGINSAVYMEIRNRGRGPDRLLGGETAAAAGVELHESVLEGDVMRMRRVEGVDLPPGETVALRPGGLHIMLLDLQRSLLAGDTLVLTLRFETAPPASIRVPVRGPGEG
jgi:copper(I)-binding protein